MMRTALVAWLMLPALGCYESRSGIVGNPDHTIIEIVDMSDPDVDATDPVVDRTDPIVDPVREDVAGECRDSDRDGVCDEHDRCPGFDDRIDGDRDGVPDGCDECQGHDDGEDANGNGVPDMCDCDWRGGECHAHATCHRRPDGIECVCNPGFEGDGIRCRDIDECATGTHRCDVHASCTNTEGDYFCTCDEGYDGDGFTCSPIDHCSRGTHLCDVHATCTYTGPGTYECECNAGYLGDGFVCTPIEPGICISANDGPLYRDSVSTGVVGLVAMRFTLSGSVRIRRCEVFTGEVSGTSTIGVWTHDYTRNRPLANLGSGSWSMSTANGWQGADLSAVLGAGPDYWVVWGPVPGSQATVQASGDSVTYQISYDGGGSWTGSSTDHLKFRCYCE
jgi:hypothetical protein